MKTEETTPKLLKNSDLLLAAEKINPAALNGSAYNSLGSLYAKVPGWPIGFGDKAKASVNYQKLVALAANADAERPELAAAKKYLAGN